MSKNKTFKREMAVAVFLFFAVSIYQGVDNEVIKAIAWPTYTFVALAFGIDWWGKSGGMQQSQSNFAITGRRPESSSEHTTGPREFSDDRDDR